MSVRIVSGMTRNVCPRHYPVFTCPLDCPQLSPDNTKTQVRPVPSTVPTCPRPVPVPCPRPLGEGTGGQVRGQAASGRPRMTLKNASAATTNPAIADRARELADEAPGGSLTRRAAGCVAVAYSTTKTDVHARKVLAELGDELRAECTTLADTITAQIQEEGS